AVADKLAGLTHLDLSGCDRVTDAGVRAVADRLAGLTQLNLGCCDRVTDAGVVDVAGGLAGLTQLRLSGCKRVTDAGVRAVVMGLTELISLSLSDINSLGVPRELLSSPGNVDAIREFYRRGESEGKRQLNEAKLIVVGNEAVGKSALVNFL